MNFDISCNQHHTPPLPLNFQCSEMGCTLFDTLMWLLSGFSSCGHGRNDDTLVVNGKNQILLKRLKQSRLFPDHKMYISYHKKGDFYESSEKGLFK
jgi:hypothetical protein